MFTFILCYVLASYWVGGLLFCIEHPHPENQENLPTGLLLLAFSPFTAPLGTWHYFQQWLDFLKSKSK